MDDGDELMELKRRVTDNEAAIAQDRADIAMLKEIAATNKEIVELIREVVDYAKKTYEVFEPMVRIGAKAVKLAAVFAAAWHGAKWAYAKMLVALS